MKDMFNMLYNFGLKCILTLDRAIQGFLQKANRLKQPDPVRNSLMGYLKWRANMMLPDLEDNIPPSMIVISSLIKLSMRAEQGSYSKADYRSGSGGAGLLDQKPKKQP
jgi:hypothetical protein